VAVFRDGFGYPRGFVATTCPERVIEVSRVSRSALVPYTPQEMFALVSDIESYPAFLPWCASTTVISRDEDEVRASIRLTMGRVEKSFTTRNRQQVNKMIEMHLLEGPFSRLDGCWRFDPLGEQGCKVALDLSYEFKNRVLGMMVGPVFGQITNTLVDAFLDRAIQVYGKR
jgi:ribosome-associated toxin RatA of RatAB toxin-antitoxin module